MARTAQALAPITTMNGEEYDRKWWEAENDADALKVGRYRLTDSGGFTIFYAYFDGDGSFYYSTVEELREQHG